MKRAIGSVVILLTAGIVLLGPTMSSIDGGPKLSPDDEAILTGTKRPPLVPADWRGAPLPNGRGWRWTDPKNPGNCVRIFRGKPNAALPADRGTYVVLTKNGIVLNKYGDSTGVPYRDDDHL